MTKIDIISGFLGAGKTTFIKKLLKEAFKGEQVVLIENEFGEIGIDGGFLKEAGIEIKEMNSGCICCSLVGDFEKSLKEVIDTYHPDRILIEPSGVGKLSDVIKAVQDAQVNLDAQLNSFTTVVDVTKCRIYSKNFGEFFSNQIEYAGAIILSRTDKAKHEKVEESVAILRGLNEKAPIITTPIEQLSGEKLLETMEGSKSLEEELLAEIVCPECGGHHDHDEECGCGHEHHHDHDEHEHHHDHDEHEHHHDHDEHEHHHHDHDEDAHEHHHGEDGHEHAHHHHDGEGEHEHCCHDHEAEHCHDHEHHHHHEHRGLAEVLDILNKADLTDRARATAVRIFTILGQAEAKAHGATLETVHFHEVGAVDSIVDITAAAVCLDNLGIEDVIVPVLYEGTGSVRCAHGVLPIPVPAVANIAAAEHLNLHITGAKGEYVTPTGAAIAAAVRTSDQLPAEFTVTKIGLGAGKREQELPGLVRAMLIRPAGSAYAAQDMICKLESNIDDTTGEALGYVMERLLAAGARDVQYSPVYMKKNRPAYLLTVLCLEEDIPALEEIIFAETTTIGIRRVRMERSILKRRLCTVQTSLGEVQVKECEVPCCAEEELTGSTEKRCYPEYESVKEICRRTGRSYQDVTRQILHDLAKNKED